MKLSVNYPNSIKKIIYLYKKAALVAINVGKVCNNETSKPWFILVLRPMSTSIDKKFDIINLTVSIIMPELINIVFNL